MLTQVEISHFKSIESCSFALDRVTLFVGNNSSGKTNIIDSIRFIRDAARLGLDRAISDRHGIESVRQWAPTRPYLITISISASEPTIQFSYSVSIASTKERFWITREDVESRELSPVLLHVDEDEVEDGFDARLILARRSKDKFEITTRKLAINVDQAKDFDLSRIQNWSNLEASVEEYPLVNDELIFFSRAWIVAQVRNRLMNFQVYSIFPNTLRQPQEPSNEVFLTAEGRNLGSVFKRMRRTKRGQDAIAQITDGMRAILPNLDRISVLNVGGYLVPQFHISEIGGKKPIFNVSQMSDGTLRVLGILTALYQQPRPNVIALEEPEQTINPGILPLIADAIREVSQTTQVLITTHSPHLLDQFAPEQIRAVELKNGRTRVGSINPAQIEIVRDRLFTLGELLVSEGLYE